MLALVGEEEFQSAAVGGEFRGGGRRGEWLT